MVACTTFLSILLTLPLLFASSENCTTNAINDALIPIALDSTYTSCEIESNYTLQAIVNPSRKQTWAFCASPACRAFLNDTLTSNRLPDCQVIIGTHDHSLTETTTFVLSHCEALHVGQSLQERAVDKDEQRSSAQSISEHIGSVLGHSAPMEDIGAVAGALLSLL